MKCVSLCLVLFSAAAVYGYPQRVSLVGIPQSHFFMPYDSVQTGREVEENPSETSEERGVPDIGVDYDPTTDIQTDQFYPVSFSDIMRSMQEAMIHLRQEMDTILKRLPAESGDEKGLDQFPVFDTDFDLNDVKNKSTSETKVIDGQLVTVNETVVRSGNDHGGAVFRIKTIQVKPTESNPTEDSSDSVELTPPPAKPEEKNDDSNDIPNTDEKIRFSEWKSIETESAESDRVNEVEATNDIEMIEPINFKPEHDLSKDTLVNDYLSDQHESQGLVMIDPDAEFIDKDNPKPNEYYRYDSQPLQYNEETSEKL